MTNSDLNRNDVIACKMLLEAMAEFAVPVLVSGKLGERFHSMGLIATSTELELVMKPDRSCAMAFTKAIRKLVRRFGYNVSMDQDAANLAVPGMRFRPFPALAGLDIIIADSKSEFEEMLVRATHSSIYDMELPILCAEDILLLKQRYVEHWRKKYEKHLADLHRLKEKLAAQTG